MSNIKTQRKYVNIIIDDRYPNIKNLTTAELVAFNTAFIKVINNLLNKSEDNKMLLGIKTEQLTTITNKLKIILAQDSNMLNLLKTDFILSYLEDEDYLQSSYNKNILKLSVFYRNNLSVEWSDNKSYFIIKQIKDNATFDNF